MPKSGENCRFPVEDGTVQPYDGDQGQRTSTLIRNHPVRGESREDFLGESKGSPPTTYFQDSYLDAGEARDEFWSISGDFIYRSRWAKSQTLHAKGRINSFSTGIYIEVIRATHTTSDVVQESRIDDKWNIDGSRDLSASWTGFTQFTLLKVKPPEGYMWSGWGLTKRQAASRLDHLWPQIWRSISRNSKMKEKQNWSSERPKLVNARKLRGIHFIDSEDMELAEIIKTARKNWKCRPLLLCRGKGQQAGTE